MDIVWVLDFNNKSSAGIALGKLVDFSNFVADGGAASSKADINTHWAAASLIEPMVDDVEASRVTVLAHLPGRARGEDNNNNNNNNGGGSSSSSVVGPSQWCTESLLKDAGIDAECLADSQWYHGTLKGAAPLVRRQEEEGAIVPLAEGASATEGATSSILSQKRGAGGYNLIVKLVLKKNISATEFWDRFEPLRVYCLAKEENTYSYEAFQQDDTTLVIVERYDTKSSLTDIHHKSTPFLTFAPWLRESNLVVDKVRLSGVVNL